MSNIVIFGPTQSGKTTLLGYLATAMLRHPQFNEEVLHKLKLIKRLTVDDEFNIGNPYNPVNVNKDIILPSFVSLDKDELRKFRGIGTEGSTKRLHRKQLTICTSEYDDSKNNQNENENATCTFIDLPGFRQRLSDKYRGFFEGNIGVAVLKLQELLEMYRLLNIPGNENVDKIDYFEGRLFEPIRIWCDYQSPSRLIIVISQIDRSVIGLRNNEEAIRRLAKDIDNAVDCIRTNILRFNRGIDIPIIPISIRISSEYNKKENARMQVFFHRNEINIYRRDLTKTDWRYDNFISCLRRIMAPCKTQSNNVFSMAQVDRPMKAVVNGVSKTALCIHALHGAIHKADQVILGPVINKQSGQIIFSKCEISSLKVDGMPDPTDVLLEGNTGGIIFKSVKDLETDQEYKISFIKDDSEITVLKSTILFCGNKISGDIVEVVINKDEYLTLNGNLDDIYSIIIPSLMPFDQIVLFWYGKKISVNIVEIAFDDDKIKLSLLISKNEKNKIHYFLLPCNSEGEIKHKDNVLLAIPQMYYSLKPRGVIQGLYTYISSSIAGIKDSATFDSVRFEVHKDLSLYEELIGNVHFERYEQQRGIESYVVPIRKKKRDIDIYSVLLVASRCIRKAAGSRGNYRRFSPIGMRLWNIEEEA